MGPPPSIRLTRPEYSTPIPRQQSVAPPGAAAFQFSVSHPDRVRLGHVEIVKVCVAPIQPAERVLDVGRKQPIPPCPIRLLVPGAMVTPVEHAVEPSPLGPVEVTFYVTALAKGDLPDARVELFRDGRHELLPIVLLSDSPRSFWVGIALAVLISLLLFLPTCWPEAAAGGVERVLSDWLPQVPVLSTALAKLGQGFYAFLATTGKSAALSFIALAGMLLGMAAWAFIRRPQVVTVAGEEFQLAVVTTLNT